MLEKDTCVGGSWGYRKSVELHILVPSSWSSYRLMLGLLVRTIVSDLLVPNRARTG